VRNLNRWSPDDEDRSDGDEVPLDEGAKDWLWHYIWSLKGIADLPEDIRDEVANRIASAPEKVLNWVPSENYKGSGFTHGSWKLVPEWFVKELRHCADEVRRELEAEVDAEHHRSLDAWLEADRKGLLKARGAKGGLRVSSLPDGLYGTLLRARYERWRTWPRNCRRCGESFRPNPPNKSIRTCPDCRGGSSLGQKPAQRQTLALPEALRTALQSKPVKERREYERWYRALSVEEAANVHAHLELDQVGAALAIIYILGTDKERK
jgi:hypothetical protein